MYSIQYLLCLEAPISLTIFLLAGLFFTFIIPPFFPSLKLFYLIPFVVRSFYVKPISKSLWYSLAIGFLMDLLSAHIRFGLMSCTYAFSTLTLYPLKRHFFEDRLTTIPIMTFFFSLISTGYYWLLLLLLDRQFIPFSTLFFLTDFIIMPLCDMIYSALCFSLPIYLFTKPARKGSDYFLQQE